MSRKINLPVEEIVSKWENGTTLMELADEYGTSHTTICKRIKKWYKENGKIKPKKIELPVEKIVLKWESGATLRELADEYGTSYKTIRRRINEWYEEKGKIDPKKYGEKKIELPIEEIVLKWENGTTLKELVDEYGTSFETIRTRINKWYEENEKEKPQDAVKRSGKKKIELPVEEIVSKWENGTTLMELANEYGISHATVSTRIKEWYEKKGMIKPKSGGPNKIELPVEEIVSKWKNGATLMELANEYGTSYWNVRRRINEWHEEQGKIKPKRGGPNKIELPVEEIVEKWKNGTTLMELANEYGISLATVSTRINEWYEEKEKPQDTVKRGKTNVIKERIVKEPKIVIEYLKRGATPEQIIEIAEKNRVVIPDSVMQEAIKKVQETLGERIQKDIGRDIND